jgi:hypothetical protein
MARCRASSSSEPPESLAPARISNADLLCLLFDGCVYRTPLSTPSRAGFSFWAPHHRNRSDMTRLSQGALCQVAALDSKRRVPAARGE